MNAMRLAFAVVALAAAAIALIQLGRRRGALVVVLVALTLTPFGILALGEPTGVVGIAPTVPTVTLYGVVLAVAGLVLLVEGRWRGMAMLALPICLYVLAAGLVVWPHTAGIASGVLHILLIACAWVVGVRIGPSLVDDVPTQRVCAQTLAVVTSALAATVAYQVLRGLPQDERATGLFSHPATIGKIAVILLGILLPLSSSSDKTVRRVSFYALALSLAMTAPTLSRANIVGLVLVIAIWNVLSPGAQHRGRTFLLTLLAVAVFIPILSSLLERFESDARGGQRPELLAAGLRVLASDPWGGTGPNGFVADVAAREWIVSVTGYPVHNSFVLVAAELGVIGAALLLLPVVVGAIKVLRLLRLPSVQGAYARGLIAMLAGVGFVGYTGWGVLQQPITELLYLVSGALVAAACTQSAPPAGAVELETSVLSRRRRTSVR